MTARTSMGEYCASTSRPDVAREALADLAGRSGLGGPVRDKPPRPLRAGQPALARPRSRWRRAGGVRVVCRASQFAKSGGMTCSSRTAMTSGRRTARRKTANVLFAVQLDALCRDAGVRSFALHPGGIITPLQRHLPMEGWSRSAGSTRTANRCTSSRRLSRARPRRFGPRRQSSSTALVASTARTAMSFPLSIATLAAVGGPDSGKRFRVMLFPFYVPA